MSSLDQNALKNIIEKVEPFDICVDIGANRGFYSRGFLQKLKGTGKLYAIELSPSTCYILKKELGHWPNLEIINCAASDYNGITKYYYGVDDCTNNIIGHDMNFIRNQEAGDIECRKIDTILENEPIIKIIKIDVEGAENLVLHGMKETLKKTKFLFIECHLDKDWQQTIEILKKDNDFEVFDIHNMNPLDLNDKRHYHIICKNKEL